METTHVEVTITSADDATVTLVHIDEDDRETTISETTTHLPGVWSRTADAEDVRTTVVDAGLAPDFERTMPGVWSVDAGVEAYAIHGPVLR